MNKELDRWLNREYPYGFVTALDYEPFPRGLNEQIIRMISAKKREPSFMLNFRLKAYQKWKQMPMPQWARVAFEAIDFQQILYYAAPSKTDEIPATLAKLGVNPSSKVALDPVFDSVSLGTGFHQALEDAGVIFCSISEAIHKYPELVKKYLASVVPIGDNFFSALNSAVFSDGSFCFIPKGVQCPMELSTYFRLQKEGSGQFERTLIIAEENSSVSYLEGCTAARYENYQLHAAVVELIALDHAKIKYSTVQNWYSGDQNGKGGIYNFVTKRGLCAGENAHISWTQVETGSAITWKYPSCVLAAKNTIGDFYSVALTNGCQQADTGSKMIHLGANSKSQIISKGICAGKSINTYRGEVKITSAATNAVNHSQCDSMILGKNSIANTYPIIQIANSDAKVEHEATTAQIGEEQLFYFQQRGISLQDAVNQIVLGFCQQVFLELPMEFATEVNQLLTFKLDSKLC
jgi:Fe-S cluster assembly protein SufB|uniref:Iron-sulfur cluster assembly SufBD family protein ycf24 n=1 Tax=Cyanidiaceae sp. MX-AZ01 TaxID=1503164 RepID=A0A060A8P3_9RHOD|nr:putative ABC transporter [Cyanidiaceae sp. MX-AZ01]